LRVAKVTVERGNSIEGAARDARRAELRKQRADFIVLAHNADDQVETVMLQLLRGTGVKGLAGMAMMREADDKNAATLLRPLIEAPRSDIERYAGERKLEWIEDPSNADAYYLRNFLRREILPRIAARVPAYRSSLTRASRHAAEAVQLIDELAALDAGIPAQGVTLSVARLSSLSAVRAKNVLRWFLSRNGVDIPAAERLEEALRQVLTAKDDARVSVSLGETALRRHAGVLHLVAESRAAAAGQVAWSGQSEIVMPGGVLQMKRDRGAGISLALLDGVELVVRDRQRGERLQPDRRRPRRSLKNLLQESGLPPWHRDALPYLYCGERLVCVPGVGVDCEFQALLDEPSVLPVWLPFGAGPAKRP
jgi:tRNA(Ile)-lysidine synthase